MPAAVRRSSIADRPFNGEAQAVHPQATTGIGAIARQLHAQGLPLLSIVSPFRTADPARLLAPRASAAWADVRALFLGISPPIDARPCC